MIFKYILISMRPYQWIKNLLVFAALLFSFSFHEKVNIYREIIAFVLFCLTSSAVYIMNDLKDIKEDRMHPVKKLRPITSGKLNRTLAVIVMSFLYICALALGFYLSKLFFIILISYIILNIGYSGGLKKVVILDVLLLSIGFLLRALAGAVVINVVASQWLFICTLMLSLLLGFGKRYNELKTISIEPEKHRKNLSEYSLAFLEKLMIIAAAAAIVTYSLYTLSNVTVNRLNSTDLIYTTPMVIFGIFRYLFLVFEKDLGGDPSKLILTDIQMMVNFVLWGFSVLLILTVII